MTRELFYFFSLMLITGKVLGNTKEGICSVCTCAEKTINCNDIKLNHSFDQNSWSHIINSSYTEASFDGNLIGHVIGFPPLPLVKLSFRSNLIVKIDDRSFQNLTNLEELCLSDNELTSNNLLPAVFQGPYNVRFYEPLKLKILDLSNNELHTLQQDLFEHLPFLERLYLKQNPFKILDRPTVIALSSIPNLVVLDLSNTKIKELPAGFLHTPKKLHELVLKGNFFTDIPSDVLSESHDLRILNLNENPIKVLSTERPFPELPSLRQLHISFMPNLSRIEEGSLSGLTGLDYLYCRMNEKLTYISPLAFSHNESEAKRPNIIRLDLSDNALRYLDEDLLKPVWGRIRHMNILGNPLVCDCENQWIVSKLIPLMMNISSPVNGLECAEPSAMRGQRLVNLHATNYTMRCLDLYGNHPEKDGPILIGIFVLIILLLFIMLGVGVWLKTNGTCRQGGHVNYHRAFYRPTTMEDPDKY